MRTIARMPALLLAPLLALSGLVAGCAQPAAPVVDLPVRSAVDDPAPSMASKPAGANPDPSTRTSEPGQVASPPAAQAKPDTPAKSEALTSVGTRSKPDAQLKPDARLGSGAQGAASDASATPTQRSAATGETAAADWPPEFYTVKKGDTLYSIALDHGQGYRDVAAWNQLADPNVIQIDQQLRVRPPLGWKEGPEEEGVAARGLDPAPPIKTSAHDPPPVKRAPMAVKLPYSDQALAQLRAVRFKPAAELAPRGEPAATSSTKQAGAASPMRAGGAAPLPPATAPGEGATSAQAAPAKPAAIVQSPLDKPGAGALTWAWPARGPLLHGFDQGANPKGIAIGGEAGQAILASAPGKVVYSGSGLRGYGKLIIIKHDPTYLSVYAHNRELLVKEGEGVGKGQKIAEMGSGEAQRPALHFEIRQQGRPVDPLRFLPSQGG